MPPAGGIMKKRYRSEWLPDGAALAGATRACPARSCAALLLYLRAYASSLCMSAETASAA